MENDKIFTVRPRDENHETSIKIITEELKQAGITKINGITRGITQPSGKTEYWVYITY